MFGLTRNVLALGLVSLLTLGNSSDAFLLLRAQETGIAVAHLPVLWTFLHLFKAATRSRHGTLTARRRHYSVSSVEQELQERPLNPRVTCSPAALPGAGNPRSYRDRVDRRI